MDTRTEGTPGEDRMDVDPPPRPAPIATTTTTVSTQLTNVKQVQPVQGLDQLWQELRVSVGRLAPATIQSTLAAFYQLLLPQTSKQDLIECYRSLVTRSGVTAFVGKLRKPILAAMAATLGLPTATAQETIGHFLVHGMEPTLQKLCSNVVLIRDLYIALYLNAASLPAPASSIQGGSSESKEKELTTAQVVSELAEEITFLGFEDVLLHLSPQVLDLYSKDLKLAPQTQPIQAIEQILEWLLDLVSLDEFIQLGGDLEPNTKRKKANGATNLALNTVSPLPGATFFTDTSEALAWNNTLLQAASSAVSSAGPPPKLVEVNEDDYAFDSMDEEEDTRKTQPKSKKKPTVKINHTNEHATIVKGVTLDELQSMFNLQELQEWCRLHSVDSTGKKQALALRIIEHLYGSNSKEAREGRESLLDADFRQPASALGRPPTLSLSSQPIYATVTAQQSIANSSLAKSLYSSSKKAK